MDRDVGSNTRSTADMVAAPPRLPTRSIRHDRSRLAPLTPGAEPPAAANAAEREPDRVSGAGEADGASSLPSSSSIEVIAGAVTAATEDAAAAAVRFEADDVRTAARQARMSASAMLSGQHTAAHTPASGLALAGSAVLVNTLLTLTASKMASNHLLVSTSWTGRQCNALPQADGT